MFSCITRIHHLINQYNSQELSYETFREYFQDMLISPLITHTHTIFLIISYNDTKLVILLRVNFMDAIKLLDEVNLHREIYKACTLVILLINSPMILMIIAQYDSKLEMMTGVQVMDNTKILYEVYLTRVI